MTDFMFRLRDEVYDNLEGEYDILIPSLKGIHREAVLIGDFYECVNRGGFRDWVESGYAIKINELQEALGSVQGVAVKRVLSMVKNLNSRIKNEEEFDCSFIDIVFDDLKTVFYEEVEEHFKNRD